MYLVALAAGLVAATLESINYWLSLVLVPALVITLAILVAYLGGLKVSLPTQASSAGRGITRIMLQLTFRGRLLEVILDFFLIGVAYYLAFLTQHGWVLNTILLERYLGTLPIALAGTYLSFFTFGVYRGVWRYVGVNDLVRYFAAAVGGVLVSAAVVYAIYSREEIVPEIFLFFTLFLFFALAASRSSFRILDQVSSFQSRPEGERVLIYGAGDSGEMIVRWILMNPALAYHPVGFLDEDPFKVGRSIHGVEVLGGVDKLISILEQRKVRGVILTSEVLADAQKTEQVISACRSRQCWVRCLRLDFEVILT
jgi:UDP-GlcNAc:undecaprenyl-phosphate GlcNAc-1-phosphate transferase